MNDAFLMRGFEAFSDLDEQGDGFIEWNRTLCDALCQRLAFHQFHDDKLLAVVLFEPMECGDVRVIDLGEEFGFSLEPRESFLVLHEFLRKDFDGDVASELGVSRPIDLAHPAFADGLKDLVMREFRAG